MQCALAHDATKGAALDKIAYDMHSSENHFGKIPMERVPPAPARTGACFAAALEEAGGSGVGTPTQAQGWVERLTSPDLCVLRNFFFVDKHSNTINALFHHTHLCL